MKYSLVFSPALILGVCLSAGALTGDGDSAVAALETVKPTLDSISALTSASLEATFSEPMLDPGASTPANYEVSGSGKGTLGANPDQTTGTGPHTLTWTAGEMQNGATVTLTGTGLQDAVGNPIDPANNSASTTGMGIAPVFSGLVADPARAADGDTVTVSFTSSEDLDGDPVVTVNGNAASLTTGSKTTDFTFEYAVTGDDAIGMASIAVSGSDLAGNLGSLGDTTALEIVEPGQGELPVCWFPAGIALLAMGVFFVMRRGRAVATLLVVLVLATPVALAQGPVVSGVAFVQQDNGAGGTQVVITYDLDAPNGPCAISVSLSKDAGVDGFAFPVTSVTGDLTDVTTGTGRTIVWDITADYPNEDIPNAQLRLTADDGVIPYNLTYSATAGGSISGDSPQVVLPGADGTPVTAVPETGYDFTGWSDGVQSLMRVDTDVSADLSVVAGFQATALDSSLGWAQRLGGANPDETGNAVAVDDSGNVYATGTFRGTATYESGLLLSLDSSVDVFVMKVNPAGSVAWALKFGSAGNENVSGIALDSQGNVYVTGSFPETADFDPGSGVYSMTPQEAGYSDTFVLKLDSDGSFCWARQFGPRAGRGGVAFDSLDNVYVSGSFKETTDFDPGAGTYELTSAGLGDGYLCKLSSDGDFVWAKRIGGTYNDGIAAVTVDASDNVYAAGQLASGSYYEVLVWKLDSSGTSAWTRKFSGTSSSHGGLPSSIAVTSGGDVYTVGTFKGTVDFDPASGTSYNLTGDTVGDAFISKLNSDGQFVWAASFGDTSNDYGLGVAVDASGNAYASGSFSGTVDFDPGAGTSDLTSAGGWDVYVLKLDSTGTLAWVEQFGAAGSDCGDGIRLDGEGNVYATGWFSGTVDFDPDAGVYNLTSSGSMDAFVLKLTQD